MSKPEPGEPRVPRWMLLALRLWDLARWPADVRRLKQAGFYKTGFMTWESGPEDADAS